MDALKLVIRAGTAVCGSCNDASLRLVSSLIPTSEYTLSEKITIDSQTTESSQSDSEVVRRTLDKWRPFKTAVATNIPASVCWVYDHVREQYGPGVTLLQVQEPPGSCEACLTSSMQRAPVVQAVWKDTGTWHLRIGSEEVAATRAAVRELFRRLRSSHLFVEAHVTAELLGRPANSSAQLEQLLGWFSDFAGVVGVGLVDHLSESLTALRNALRTISPAERDMEEGVPLLPADACRTPWTPSDYAEVAAAWLIEGMEPEEIDQVVLVLDADSSGGTVAGSLLGDLGLDQDSLRGSLPRFAAVVRSHGRAAAARDPEFLGLVRTMQSRKADTSGRQPAESRNPALAPGLSDPLSASSGTQRQGAHCQEVPPASREHTSGQLPPLRRSERSRETNLYTPQQRRDVVRGYLFDGSSFKELEERVLKIDPAFYRGWQAMSICHYLGIREAHKGIFANTTLEESIKKMEAQRDPENWAKIIRLLDS